MIIVSNTSPLTNLASIGQFDLLRLLYSEINIAEGVWEELNAGGKPYPGSRQVEKADWIFRHKIINQFLVKALRRDIGRGESESIVLSLEIGADMILLDEKEGRNISQTFQLKAIRSCRHSS
jgi:predicted nucleic acid-binding protein